VVKLTEKSSKDWAWWLKVIILATSEVEISRITV
jgi:hypothetical protein